MGGIDCRRCGHIRSWDLRDEEIGDETFIEVNECYSCGDPTYWEVYATPGDDEFLAAHPLRTVDALPLVRQEPQKGADE